MNERADRAIVVGEGRGLVTCRKRSGRHSGRCMRAEQDRRVSRERCAAVEMHVAERHGELEGQREQRQPGPQARMRPEPMHRRYARCASPQAAEPCPQRNFSNNVTLRQSADPRFVWSVAENHHSPGSRSCGADERHVGFNLWTMSHLCLKCILLVHICLK
jgi:hypothetical protein